jgi:hypothetical protein
MAGIQTLTQQLAAHLAAEGKEETVEMIGDWLYNLYELSAAGQNVADLLVNIETSCAACGLNYRAIKDQAKIELGSRRKQLV